MAGGAQRSLREAAVRRLVELGEAGPLSREQVALAAQGVGVSERTMWRWVALATGRAEPVVRQRLTLDPGLRERLAFWRGNIAAVHRELVDAAAVGGPPAPGLTTLRRAVRGALSPGELAGLRKGERVARAHDVFLQRPATYRNAAWEGDHVEASVEVDVDGQLVKPWVTWFVDCCGPRSVWTSRTGLPVGCRSWCGWTGARTSCRRPWGRPARCSRCGWRTCPATRRT